MAGLAPDPLILTGEGWDDYALLDSGHGRKFERYGPYRFVRPEPQALWSPRLAEWDADGEFVPGSDEDGGGRWHFARPVPREGWELARGDVRFTAQCTPFRHLGFFPDMAPVWDWMGGHAESSRGGRPGTAGASARSVRSKLAAAPRQRSARHLPRGRLQLSTCSATPGSARWRCQPYGPVTHVDASKKSVAQARANAALSGMAERPVRWMVDDAANFAAREVRRGQAL